MLDSRRKPYPGKNAQREAIDVWYSDNDLKYSTVFLFHYSCQECYVKVKFSLYWCKNNSDAWKYGTPGCMSLWDSATSQTHNARGVEICHTTRALMCYRILTPFNCWHTSWYDYKMPFAYAFGTDSLQMDWPILFNYCLCRVVTWRVYIWIQWGANLENPPDFNVQMCTCLGHFPIHYRKHSFSEAPKQVRNIVCLVSQHLSATDRVSAFRWILDLF